MPRESTGGPPVVLCVGTTPNKNLERTADALRGLEVDLRVIGRLSDEQRRHLDGTGLRWTHATSLNAAEMRRAYDECDVVAFASTYEGFGMPIVEANAVGRPVVTGGRAPMNWVAGDSACSRTTRTGPSW
jgi:glycosyltransferase involved in cell wall biosynthesis